MTDTNLIHVIQSYFCQFLFYLFGFHILSIFCFLWLGLFIWISMYLGFKFIGRKHPHTNNNDNNSHHSFICVIWREFRESEWILSLKIGTVVCACVCLLKRIFFLFLFLFLLSLWANIQLRILFLATKYLYLFSASFFQRIKKIIWNKQDDDHYLNENNWIKNDIL